MGQLPLERVTPDIVFENVEIDFVGPLYINHGYVRKPTVVKAYVCVFVSMSMKAVHLLIGRPVEALPDSSYSYQSISLLRHWHMCQNIVRHFWQRWLQEYLSTLRKFVKWQKSS